MNQRIRAKLENKLDPGFVERQKARRNKQLIGIERTKDYKKRSAAGLIPPGVRLPSFISAPGR